MRTSHQKTKVMFLLLLGSYSSRDVGAFAPVRLARPPKRSASTNPLLLYISPNDPKPEETDECETKKRLSSLAEPLSVMIVAVSGGTDLVSALLGDASHLFSDYSNFFTLDPSLIQLVEIVGRLLTLLHEYRTHGTVAPDELFHQILLMGLCLVRIHSNHSKDD